MHNLTKDCNDLTEFFNSTASIADDVSEMKLSANEEIFNQKKQALMEQLESVE